jgi:hypothetical protein
MLIGLVVLLNTACLLEESFEFPVEQARNKLTYWSILAVVMVCLGQIGWISMDRRRQGREVGFWRFAVILLIPLTIAVYAAGILLPAGILLALGR